MIPGPLKKIINLSLISLLICIFMFCAGQKGHERQVRLPFPDDQTAAYYQSRVDSSEYDWYIDSKEAAASFVNEYDMVEDGYSATDAILIGEGIFHATVEVELPDKILTLELERPFKYLGRKSIWQVVGMKEKPWPKK